MVQSYQQVSKIIRNNLIGLKRLGVSNLNKIEIEEYSGNYQNYFYYRKKLHPEIYKRITFDTNGSSPFSKDLASIIMDFKICGVLDYECNIMANNNSY